MNRKDLIDEIEKFKSRTNDLYKLLLDSRDCMADIVKNHEEIAALRSELNRTYARLEKFVLKFGNNPYMSDGVWRTTYPVYDNAFSADILQRVGPSLKATIQDQDYIIGKLEGMDDKEFDDKLNPPKLERKQVVNDSKGESMSKNYHFTNCNVTFDSKEVIQSLNITKPEIKGKIKELEQAILEKNPSKITKTFGYIADKAVDVAIALLVNGINK